MSTIGFIGAGNMARSIIGGLIKQGIKAENIFASDLNEQGLTDLSKDLGINVSTDNSETTKSSDVLVLAVKPQVMATVCEDLKPAIKDSTLVISIAAGITCSQLKNWLGPNTKIVRCMPNTPALIQQGATGLYADNSVTEAERKQAEDILSAVGIVNWVDSEDLIDSVTAVSGSGPAYFFYFLEGMVEAGIQQGLSPQIAKDLAIQTAIGASQLAQTSEDELAELRRKVTSPGGTTEQAILSFEQSGLKDIIIKAMQACADRSRELAKNS